MINDDVLRKWIRNHPTDENPDRRLCMFNRDILRIKLGFTGIGNRHMSLITLDQVKRGDRIIWDYYIDMNGNGHERTLNVSPKIFQLVSLSTIGDPHTAGILLGIGEGDDREGDPNRELVIGKTYLLDNFVNYPVVLRLDSMGRYKHTDRRSWVKRPKFRRFEGGI